MEYAQIAYPKGNISQDLPLVYTYDVIRYFVRDGQKYRIINKIDKNKVGKVVKYML